jgi:beta-lactamase class A
VAYHLAVLGSTAGWVGASWFRGAALIGGLVAALGTVMCAATSTATTGRLVDATGQPVADAAVHEDGGLLSAPLTVHSDALGRYRAGPRRWPDGIPDLVVEAPGFLAGRTAGGRLVLHRWPRVSGRVVEDGGAPVAGAVVLVASRGAVVRVGLTDLDGRFQLDVPPAAAGDAVVTALMDQHDPAGQAVRLDRDRTAAVQLALARQVARLRVESDPAGQAPQIDGQTTPDCPATPCEITVLSGAHRVAFGSDDFVPWSQDVSVGKAQTAGVRAQLQRKTGTLNVAAPAGGELAVDGQTVRAAGSWSGAVPTGKHTVVFRSPATWPAIGQATVAWNQAAQVSLSPTAVAANDVGAFTGALRAYLGAQGAGSFGVYLENVTSGATLGLGDTASLEAASVIKVPEALYLLHQVDAGQVQLSDQVDLHPEDFMGGTGTLYGSAHPGDKLSYQQLLSVLIQQSDNTAWMALRRVLSDGKIDAYAASLGAGDCRQGTDGCSARSAGHLLAQLARGRVLGAGSTQLLISLLETTAFNDRIPYYLGRATVAHKVGMDPGNGVANDCGVVYQSGGDPIAVCVFTTTGNPDNGAQVIRDIARAAVQLW